MFDVEGYYFERGWMVWNRDYATLTEAEDARERLDRLLRRQENPPANKTRIVRVIRQPIGERSI
jgi:hypothetical protein